MENKFRLEKSILPTRYEINLQPNLNEEHFSGSEKIFLDIKEKTSSIKINSVGLKIEKAKITDGKAWSDSSSILDDKEHETLTLIFDNEFPKGEYILKIDFKGKLDNSLRGFYMSTYQDESGVDHKIGTTQFESTDARRAFPCFDEPEFKAVFSVTLKVEKDLFTVSNTAIKKLTKSETHDIYQFEDTIKMSTYLVAFIIGPFEATKEIDVEGVPLRIIHALGKAHLVNFAIQTAEFALKYFSDYFGRPYPGDKLDMVAIPDFASGAMENLGCITYREALLLVNEEEATQAELTRIADVVMHEIAHMWFGDLVTMKWWNGIWLNEAFATFMATKAVDKFNPKWERWVEFGIEKSAAFDVDSLHSTRPIEFEVVSPDDASAMFDLLTYEKGGAVLRMLEQYVGEDSFREGIRHYLKKHEFSNTETGDLWDSIEEYSRIPVRETMNSWILQPGYPRISFDVLNNTVSLKQATFKYDNLNNGLIWKVPIEIKMLSESKVESKKILLEDSLEEFSLGERKIIYGNVNANGFYRSEYSEDSLIMVLNNIENLNKFERFSLVDDLWSSTVSCNNTIDTYIEAVMSFINDEDPALQSLILATLTSLKRYVDKELKHNYISQIQNYILHLLDKIGDIPNESETKKTKELRSIIYRGLGITCENNEYITKARNIFDQYNKNKSSLDPNLLATVVSIVANHGDENTYEEYFSRYQSASTPQEKMRFLFSLAEFKDSSLLNQTLEASISKEVKNQDAPYLIAYTLRNYRHTETVWNFLENNWEIIKKKFPDNSIPRIFGGVKIVSSKRLASRIVDFFNNNPIPQGQKTIDQNIEKMYINIKFIEYQKEILNRFVKNGGRG